MEIIKYRKGEERKWECMKLQRGMKIRLHEGRNGNENTGSQREEWGRIQEGGNENVLCIQEVEERKPKAWSSFLWGIRGSHHHSSIQCFDKIFTFCFVAGAKLNLLSGL